MKQLILHFVLLVFQLDKFDHNDQDEYHELQNLFRIGFQRLVRKLRNQTNKIDSSQLLSFNVINATVREFFGSSQLSQYLDQTNPLSSLTHRRRISGLGPGGFDRDRISFAVRDIHPSHYGRICPIETPEGQNIGLVVYQSLYSKINEFGFVETPAVKICKELTAKADLLENKIADEDIKDGRKILIKDGEYIDAKTAKAIEKVHGKK